MLAIDFVDKADRRRRSPHHIALQVSCAKRVGTLARADKAVQGKTTVFP